MTIVEQSPAEEMNTGGTGAGDDSSTKEKKSVLKKVTDKAKDKMKKLGSKLKPKGHDGGDRTGEHAEQAPADDEDDGEELEELLPGDAPQSDSTSRDLDVPLDEYALIKQKESEKRDDEASAKGGLGDNLTEGLSSQSIAEQPSEGAPEALQAVPTEYHYREEEVPEKDANVASEPNKDDASASVPKDEKVSSEAKGDDVSDQNATGIGTQDRSWPEEDLSLKTQGQVGDTPDEKPHEKVEGEPNANVPSEAKGEDERAEDATGIETQDKVGDTPTEGPDAAAASPEEGKARDLSLETKDDVSASVAKDTNVPSEAKGEDERVEDATGIETQDKVGDTPLEKPDAAAASPEEGKARDISVETKDDVSASVAKDTNVPSEAKGEDEPAEKATGIETQDKVGDTPTEEPDASPEEWKARDLSGETKDDVSASVAKDTIPGEAKGEGERAEHATGIETQDKVGDTPVEKPDAPAASPEEGQARDISGEAKDDASAGPKFSDEDIKALSSSNLYTGEPDVKANKEEHEKKDEGGDALVSTKPGEEQQELKDNVPSAETKLQEETSANVDQDDVKSGSTARAADTQEDRRTDEIPESDRVSDKSLDGDETYADANPDMDSTDAAANAPELAGNDSGAAENETSGAAGSKLTDEKNEVPQESEVLGKDSVQAPTSFEDSSNSAKEEEQKLESSLKTPEKDIDAGSMETQAPSDAGEALEKSLGDDAAAKSDAEIKEEKGSVPEGSDGKNADAAAMAKEIGDAKQKSEAVGQDPGTTQSLLQNIAAKFGYGAATSPTTEHKNTEK